MPVIFSISIFSLHLYLNLKALIVLSSYWSWSRFQYKWIEKLFRQSKRLSLQCGQRSITLEKSWYGAKFVYEAYALLRNGYTIDATSFSWKLLTMLRNMPPIMKGHFQILVIPTTIGNHTSLINLSKLHVVNEKINSILPALPCPRVMQLWSVCPLI